MTLMTLDVAREKYAWKGEVKICRIDCLLTLRRARPSLFNDESRGGAPRKMSRRG